MGSSCCKLRQISSYPSYDSRLDQDFLVLDKKYFKQRYRGDFHRYCTNNSVDDVKSVVETHNVNINDGDGMGRTPLHLAAMKGRLDIVQFLVSIGAEVKSDSIYEQSPLHAAALGNQPEICKYLVSVGADVNRCDSAASTPLFLAVQKGCKETVLALIESGADVNVKEAKQRIPFHSATASDDVTMMSLLYKHGADPEARNNLDYTPLHVCAEYGCYAAAHFLIVTVCVSMDIVNANKRTAFHIAMINRHRYILDLLVRAGCDIQREESIYDRPPHWILGVDDEQKLTQRFASVARNPRGLQDLCIFRIRRLLRRRLSCVVDTLPSPPKVKKLLKLDHIPQFKKNSAISNMNTK